MTNASVVSKDVSNELSNDAPVTAHSEETDEMNTRPQSHADAARRVRPKAPPSAKKLANGAHKAKANGSAAHGKSAAAKSSATRAKPSAVRTKTPSNAARKAPTSSAVRKLRSSPPASNAQDNEMKETIAFRLSSDENDLLDRRKNDLGIEVSLTLRSLLITHLLIGHERIVSATFIGGYKAAASDKTDKWFIADKEGEQLHKNIDRDEALIRCEWIAQVAAGTASTTKASRTKAFRLSLDEHTALTKFKETNDTTFSAALRHFLTTQLVKKEERLLEVCFKNDYRAYPAPDGKGWCVAVGETRIHCELSREDALKNADMLSRAACVVDAQG